MTKAREALSCVALVLLCALLGLALYTLWPLRHDGQVLHDTLRDTHVTVLEAGLTLKNLREASATWEQASKEQSSQTTEAMEHVSAAAGQVTILVSKMDTSVNSVLLPAVTQAIQQQNASLLDSQKQLRENLQEMQYATQQLQKTLSDADAVIAAPELKVTLDNAATSSQNLASATGEAAETMKGVHKAVDKEVHDILAPANKAKVAVMFIAQVAGRFLGY